MTHEPLSLKDGIITSVLNHIVGYIRFAAFLMPAIIFHLMLIIIVLAGLFYYGNSRDSLALASIFNQPTVGAFLKVFSSDEDRILKLYPLASLLFFAGWEAIKRVLGLKKRFSLRRKILVLGTVDALIAGLGFYLMSITLGAEDPDITVFILFFISFVFVAALFYSFIVFATVDVGEKLLSWYKAARNHESAPIE